MNWIPLAQEKVWWQTLVNIIAENQLSGCWHLKKASAPWSYLTL
jgi:hypothetical protein